MISDILNLVQSLERVDFYFLERRSKPMREAAKYVASGLIGIAWAVLFYVAYIKG